MPALQWLMVILVLVALIVVAAVLGAASKKAQQQAVASGWRGRVLSIDFSRGLPGSDQYAARINPTESYVWVKYQCDDGTQDAFYVGEYSGAGRLSPGYVDSDFLSYREVVDHWKPGVLIEKEPGDQFPRLVTS